MIIYLLLLYIIIFIPTIISIYNLSVNKKKPKIKELKRYRNIEVGDTIQLKFKHNEIPYLANKLFEVKNIIELNNKKYAILYEYNSDVVIRRNIEYIEKVF